ncbi:MAG: flagellar basal body P-ring formation chaperone FlgA [Gammaproteobacteria bacterium]|nr:flagellar basal body P-ring formation chaperone FlgA [Gammaproteobacteria bacterium]MDH3768395.1 flagellar basal body P-ring formation chaperone FlgA [Gammaproteobacteria bacterium]
MNRAEDNNAEKPRTIHGRPLDKTTPLNPNLRRYALALMLLLPGSLNATQWQALSEVRSVAEQFALSVHGSSSSRTVEAGLLDNRLHLKNCAGELEAFLPPGTRAGPNMTVGVRCNNPSSWKVFVPVRSHTAGWVLVSRRPLERGYQPGENDVELAKHDLDRLPYGYLTDPQELAGRILRRAVQPGAVIIPPMLGQARVVRRGQTVTLYSDRSGVRIRMAGKALMNGALQQRIRVENLSSGRVVEGIVRSDERVEVLTN